LHALCVLDGLGGLTPAAVRRALADAHPGVRRQAVRLAGPRVNASPDLGAALEKLTEDADAQVRVQLACTLGEGRDPRAGRALGALAVRHADDPYLTAAVLSSVRRENLGSLLSAVFVEGADRPPPEAVVERVLGVAAALGDRTTLPKILRKVCTPDA